MVTVMEKTPQFTIPKGSRRDSYQPLFQVRFKLHRETRPLTRILVNTSWCEGVEERRKPEGKHCRRAAPPLVLSDAGKKKRRIGNGYDRFTSRHLWRWKDREKQGRADQ